MYNVNSKLLVALMMLGSLSGCTNKSTSAEDSNAIQMTCHAESFRKLPDVRLTSVTEETGPAPHCKVAGTIGTETKFELLLPADWNGKFVFGGGGGFVGVILNTALGYDVLEKGYATVGTDTGHSGNVLDASWALNNQERVVSFGHQAIHRTAVTAKALISDYYGKESSVNLFHGCSRGGGQALMEAQRYPDDFDGIVAGAPAYSWTEELAGRNTWLNQVMYPNPDELGTATMSPDALQILGEAVMQQCDMLDGIEDGILNNPLACDFDVSTLACETGKSNACLSDAQLNVAERVYGGLIVDGEQIVPGYPLGAELGAGGWSQWIAGGLDVVGDNAFPRIIDPSAPSAHYAYGNGVMKYLILHDPDWDYSTYDFSTFHDDVAAVSSTLDATNPDLDAFRARGGKLLMYNGWRDMALTPLGTIKYYEQVVARDGEATNDVRLFMVPGMEHCAGGLGPDRVNWVDEIDKWVTTKKAPEQVTAFWIDSSKQSTGSRLACAYPDVLEYDGKGNPRDARSFSCVSDN